MHPEILSEEQKKLLPLVQEFRRGFYLVRGTAIALYLGHRESLVFDLFTHGNFNAKTIINKLYTLKIKYQLRYKDYDQLHILINGIKITFYQYPFPIEPLQDYKKVFKIPGLLKLAAMKAFALGGKKQMERLC